MNNEERYAYRKANSETKARQYAEVCHHDICYQELVAALEAVDADCTEITLTVYGKTGFLLSRDAYQMVAKALERAKNVEE